MHGKVLIAVNTNVPNDQDVVPAEPKKMADIEIPLDYSLASPASPSQPDDQQSRGSGKPGLSKPAFLGLFTVCTVTYSMFTVFLHLCPIDSKGNYLWLTGSVVMVTELVKLILSLTFLACQWYMGQPGAEPIHLPRGLSGLLPYGVPAALYAINNNLGAILMLEMDPVSYQILSNLKILTTALLFRAIMRQQISRIQWFALVILLGAGVSNTLGGLKTESRSSASLHVTPLGLVMLLAYCTISGLAGVYTEYVLKKQAAVSIHLQNSLLYVYGIALNLAVFAVQSAAYNRNFDLLQGYDRFAWAVVASQAIGGITMGMLMKFASNITKLFVVSTAMLLTTIATVLLFNFSVNAYCVIAFVCVVLSQYIYYNGCAFDCVAK